MRLKRVSSLVLISLRAFSMDGLYLSTKSMVAFEALYLED